MKAVVISTDKDTATILGMDGIISRIKNNGYSAGDELNIRVLEKTASRGKITSITSRISKNAARIAAAALVMIIGAGSVSVYAMPCSTVTVDINPSLEYKVNVFNRVISVASYNDDGSGILDRIPAKLTNKSLDTVMDMTLDALEEAEYISSETSVVITVDSRFHNEAKVEADVMDSMNKWNEKKQSEGKNVSVAAETVTITDDMRIKAREMHETPGKIYMDEKKEAEARAAEEAAVLAQLEAESAIVANAAAAVPTVSPAEPSVQAQQAPSDTSEESSDPEESSDEAQIKTASADPVSDPSAASSSKPSDNKSDSKSSDKKGGKGGKKGGSKDKPDKSAETADGTAADPAAVVIPAEGGVIADPTIAAVADPAAVPVTDPAAVSVTDPTAAAITDPTLVAVVDPTAIQAGSALTGTVLPAGGTVEVPVPMPDGTIAMVTLPEAALQATAEPTAVPTAEPVPTVEPTVIPTLPPVPVEIVIPPVAEEVNATVPVPVSETQSPSDSSSEEDETVPGDQKADEQPEEQLSQDGSVKTAEETVAVQ